MIFTNEQFADNDHIPGHENLVVVQHADGTVIRYAHLMQNGVEATQGAIVQPGDLLGFSGNSGNSSGPHLHIDLLRNNLDFSNRTRCRSPSTMSKARFSRAVS